MKKLLVLCLSAVLAVSLAACGGGAGEEAGDLPPNNEAVSELTPEERKANAEKVDGVYSVAAKLSRNYYDILAEKLEALDGPEGSLVDVYATCDDVIHYLKGFSEHLDTVEDEAAAAYKEAVNNYISNIRLIAYDAQDFIDTADYSKAARMQEGIELMGYCENQILTERTNYLTAAGFSPDEIEKLLAE